LGHLYARGGKPAEGEKFYQGALSIHDNLEELRHPDILLVLCNLADLCAQQARYGEAAALYRRALAAAEELGLDLGHPDVASAYRGYNVVQTRMID
jgi:tetratricopeptide (TPR) repeat protein